MERILKHKKDNELLKYIIQYNNLLKESFIKKDKSNLKIKVPEFSISKLNQITELKICLGALKHNYKQLLRYLNDNEYSPTLKIIYLSIEDSYPVYLLVGLEEYLSADFYTNKKELFGDKYDY